MVNIHESLISTFKRITISSSMMLTVRIRLGIRIAAAHSFAKQLAIYTINAHEHITNY